MSIKTDSLYIDNFPALHAGLVGNENWEAPASGRWVPSITGEGATGQWGIDISGTAAEIGIAPSGDDIYGPTSKLYLPLCPSGDNSTMLYSSQYFYISGTSQEIPYIRGVCASPWLVREKDLYNSSANYILLGRAPNKGDARFDGYGSTTEYPAYYSNDLSLVKLQNGAVKYTALQVPDLIIGSAATPAHLLSQKTITIAGNTLSLFGNNNTISRQDLLQSLGLSYALRFVGMTNDANLREGYDQAPNDRPGYVPSFGDVIIGSGPIGGREFVWTPKSGFYPYDGPGSWTLLGVETSSYKVKQDIVTNPTLDESMFVSYCIDSITQNQQGVITATKRPIYANYAHMVDQVLKNDSAQYHPLLFGNLTTDTEENTILSSHSYMAVLIYLLNLTKVEFMLIS